MSSEDQRDYLLRRAREERAIAICCENNTVALTHFNFADEYDRRAAELASDRQIARASLQIVN